MRQRRNGAYVTESHVEPSTIAMINDCDHSILFCSGRQRRITAIEVMDAAQAEERVARGKWALEAIER